MSPNRDQKRKYGVRDFSSLKRSNKFSRNFSGNFTCGTFERFEPTNVRINIVTACLYFFNFTADDRKSHTVSGDTHTEALSIEPKELLACNPKNPNESVFIDIFPNSVKKQVFKKYL